jgi:hypothetical protein
MLELNTVAHIACAIILYLISWLKPKDVTVPQTVKVPECLALIISEETEFVSMAPYQREPPSGIADTRQQYQSPHIITELEIRQRDTVKAGWSNLDLENPSPLKVYSIVAPSYKMGSIITIREKNDEFKRPKDQMEWPGYFPETNPMDTPAKSHSHYI